MPIRIQKRKGQSLVEFTLMFPIFLAVVIGLAAFSILFYSYVTMHFAVREATSAAVRNPRQSVDAVRTVACNSAFALTRNTLTVQVEPPDTTAIPCSNPNTGTAAPATWVPGGPIAVRLTYSVPIPSATIPVLGGGNVRFGPIPLTAQSRMTIE